MTKLLFKILLMGDAGSGKTALINAYIQGTYERQYISGLKNEFYIKNEEMPDGTTLKLQVHDFMPSSLKYLENEIFLTQNLPGTSLVLLCYDMNKSKTLQNCVEWIRHIKNSMYSTKICLVGCKSDLPLKVDLNFAEEIIRKYELEFHEMTSAKELRNVNQLFHHCAEWCFKNTLIE